MLISNHYALSISILLIRRRSLLPEQKILKKQQSLSGGTPFAMHGYPVGLDEHGNNHSNSLPRIITFGSMPSYREDKMLEMKQQQKSTTSVLGGNSSQQSKLVQGSSSQPQSATSSTQHFYTSDNRKDSATSPVDPTLIDPDDELLLIEDRSHFIELSPSNLPKLSVKDKLLANANGQRWASMMGPTLTMNDLGPGPSSVMNNVGTSTITTPLLQQDDNMPAQLHHSRHSLHRQSSQGTNSVASGSPLTEVDRTLNLDGYHEDLVEVLHSVSQRQQLQHQKSLECIRNVGLGGTNSAAGSGGDGSGPASLGRQTPSDLNKKYMDSDYSSK